LRVTKQFVVHCRLKGTERVDSSPVKDISRSGICFNTSLVLERNSNVIIDLMTPYAEGKKVLLEAVVVAVKEMPITKIHQIRAKFINPDKEALRILSLIENFNQDRAR
ncbi:MAG: PilZ domain-containing protein, partial [Candidatus Omnitrophota bacterium]